MESIADIMERDVISVQYSDSLAEVVNVFEQIKIRHIPVMTGKTLIGIISHTDVRKFSHLINSSDQDHPFTDENITAQQIMTADVITIHGSESILKAAEIFSKNQISALPVVDNDELVGIVTTTDLMRYFVTHFQ